MKKKDLWFIKAAAIPAGAFIVLSAANASILANEETSEPVQEEAVVPEVLNTEAVLSIEETAALEETKVEPTEVQEETVKEEESPVQETETSGEITADRDAAIKEVYVPKTDEEGNLHKENLSDWTVGQLDPALKGQVSEQDGKKSIHVDFQIQDVYLSDGSKNGVSGTGSSYIKMTNFFVKVKEAKSLLDQNPDAVLYDSQNHEISAQYLNSLISLLEQINVFDPLTNLKYDWNSAYDSKDFSTNNQGGTDIIATSKDGLASFKFHMDSHGYWGYELVGDTIMNKIMSATDTNGNKIEGGHRAENNYLANKYGNFFVIEMNSDDKGTWYMLRDTDLENMMLYVSKDKKEAALLDTDFYGENVLNNVLKTVIGPNAEVLKILITHNHPDHANNLAVIAKDDYLRSIAQIYWPEGESHTKVNGVDVLSYYSPDQIHYVKDMENFTAGGVDFQFIQIKDEHTPNGGQYADLTHKVLHSGDTLGAQVHLGGTNVSTSALLPWIAGAQKTIDYIEANDIRYNFGGHTPYANDPHFADWLLTALEEAYDLVHADKDWKGGVVVVENGAVITPERQQEMMKNGLTDREELKVLSVNFRNNGLPDQAVVKGDFDAAVSEITVPKWDANGKDISVSLSKDTISKLDGPITATITNGKDKKVTVDFAVKNVYLEDGSKNGVSGTGSSYYKMMNFYAKVKQAAKIMDKFPGAVLVDSNGDEVDADYIVSLLDLLDQINRFDPTVNLAYNWDSVYDSNAFKDGKLGGTDVIATSKDGKASFMFHMDAHGYWGYDLAGDSIMSEVMGAFDDEGNPLTGTKKENDHYLATKYGNFLPIKMKEDENGTWYMLRNTDLENPVLYISKDGSEAFMIDVDFYGEHVINNVIKSLIKDAKSLKIFLTHNHGDHVNNLSVIASDPDLKAITTILWPENEPHTKKDGVDVVDLFDKVETIKDMDTFKAAGNTFQFVQIPNEHTPGGGQLADLSHKVMYSGDTLGAQVHLGGTTIGLSNAKNWLEGAQKSAQYIKDNGILYNIGGHTPYLNNPNFASWLETAIKYALEQVEKDPTWQGLVIVENGKVVDDKRKAEMFKNGLSDREELAVLSANFRNDLKPSKPSEEQKPEEGQKPEESEKPETSNPQTPNTSDKKEETAGAESTKEVQVVTTAASLSSKGFSLSALMAGIGAIFFAKKRKED